MDASNVSGVKVEIGKMQTTAAFTKHTSSNMYRFQSGAVLDLPSDAPSLKGVVESLHWNIDTIERLRQECYPLNGSTLRCDRVLTLQDPTVFAELYRDRLLAIGWSYQPPNRREDIRNRSCFATQFAVTRAIDSTSTAYALWTYLVSIAGAARYEKAHLTAADLAWIAESGDRLDLGETVEWDDGRRIAKADLVGGVPPATTEVLFAFDVTLFVRDSAFRFVQFNSNDDQPCRVNAALILDAFHAGGADWKAISDDVDRGPDILSGSDLMLLLTPAERPFPTTMAPSPRGLVSHLLPFQSEAVAWMVERETVGFQTFLPVVEEDCYYSPLLNLFRRTAFPDVYGGFLCSQFGLGKTVMVLALLLARRVPKTLVVTSTSLLTQWQAEISSKTDLQCSLVHGHRVEMTGEVVLTTYGKIRRNQWRFAVTQFDRIVLDESHTIRNSGTSACKILSSLQARSRWCVTATPANQLVHLSGQLKFLTGAAWTHDMFTQLLRSRLPYFKQGNRLAHFASVMCRGHDRSQRYDSTGASIVTLADCTFHRVNIPLPQEIKSQYVRAVRLLPSGLAMGQLLSFVEKIRSWCSGGALLGSTGPSPAPRQHVVEDVGAFLEEYSTCAICLCFPTAPMLTPCAHVFCEECMGLLFTRAPSACPCPLCRAPLTPESMKCIVEEGADDDEESTPKQQPTDIKIRTAFDCMARIFAANAGAKIVVFSQFIPCLEQMVEKSALLLPRDVQRSYIHGSTPQKKRAREIDAFVHAESGAVIFLSVRSAGCGLNLQSASDAIMMEPLLNKGLEKQCFGRINRIGRVGRATVHRLYLDGTIEQRILELEDDVVVTRERLLGLL